MTRVRLTPTPPTMAAARPGQAFRGPAGRVHQVRHQRRARLPERPQPRDGAVVVGLPLCCPSFHCPSRVSTSTRIPTMAESIATSRFCPSSRSQGGFGRRSSKWAESGRHGRAAPPAAIRRARPPHGPRRSSRSGPGSRSRTSPARRRRRAGAGEEHLRLARIARGSGWRGRRAARSGLPPGGRTKTARAPRWAAPRLATSVPKPRAARKRRWRRVSAQRRGGRTWRTPRRKNPERRAFSLDSRSGGGSGGADRSGAPQAPAEDRRGVAGRGRRSSASRLHRGKRGGSRATLAPASAEAVQVAAVAAQPGLGLLGARAEFVHELPKLAGVVELAQVCHLMGGEVVEDSGGARIRRQEKLSAPPRRAGPPTARGSRTVIRFTATPSLLACPDHSEHCIEHRCPKWKLYRNSYRWRCSELYECTKPCPSGNDSNTTGYTNTFNIRQPCLCRHECDFNFKRCSQWRNLHLV